MLTRNPSIEIYKFVFLVVKLDVWLFEVYREIKFVG
jgi:hypothetical protein